MMAFEGPFLAAIVARLPDATHNLAAYGVAVAVAILVEAPVIMILSASTALAGDALSFRRLRNFSAAFNAAVTAGMVLVLIPPVFRLALQRVIGLADPVAHLTHGALLILLPWPGAIGYRRFYQGLLIRAGRTRLVASGTILRITAMTGTAVFLYAAFALPGAYVGAAALSAGVCGEALVVRLMARPAVRDLLATAPAEGVDAERLGYRDIARFYYPLALTSVIGLIVQPLLTLFMGRARLPVESLAVFPVVHSLSFLFRALGLSYQEAAIALLGKRNEHAAAVGRFALWLAIAASAGLGAIAFTPLAEVWFVTVSGLVPDLAALAVRPTQILVPLPALAVLLSCQRALLVNGRSTRPITGGTVLEIVAIALLFVAASAALGVPGVTAAAIAFLGGRMTDAIYLAVPSRRAARRFTGVRGRQ
jgi:Na+-driven multidrug efflux pump